MSDQQDALSKAQARAQEAAKSETEPEAHGDLHESAQQISNEHASAHAKASGMSQASDQRHSQSKETMGDNVRQAKDKELEAAALSEVLRSRNIICTHCSHISARHTTQTTNKK